MAKKYTVFIDGMGVGSTDDFEKAKRYAAKMAQQTDEKIQVVNNETDTTEVRYN